MLAHAGLQESCCSSAAPASSARFLKSAIIFCFVNESTCFGKCTSPSVLRGGASTGSSSSPKSPSSDVGDASSSARSTGVPTPRPRFFSRYFEEHVKANGRLKRERGWRACAASAASVIAWGRSELTSMIGAGTGSARIVACSAGGKSKES